LDISNVLTVLGQLNNKIATKLRSAATQPGGLELQNSKVFCVEQTGSKQDYGESQKRNAGFDNSHQLMPLSQKKKRQVNPCCSQRNDDTFLVFPMETDDIYDQITLNNQDFEMLEPGKCINDNLVDLYTRLIILNLPTASKDRFHAFNSLFYTKLCEAQDNKTVFNHDAAFGKVCRWTKKVDIFSKALVLFPIFDDSHWSLCVAVHPNEFATSECINSRAVGNKSCLLFMDSLRMHNIEFVGERITNYLSNEWKAKKGNIREGNIFKTMRKIRCNVPKQDNCYDCGIFTSRYIEEVLNKIHLSDSVNFNEKFNSSLFTQQDMTNQRVKFKETLVKLKKDTMGLKNRPKKSSSPGSCNNHCENKPKG
jgi:Ulp1 family protease